VEHVAANSSDDERYLVRIGEAQRLRIEQRYAEAIDIDLQALKLRPELPLAYFGLAKTYGMLRDWPKVVHWTEIGRSLPVLTTMSAVDPREYDFNWIIFYTNALFNVGDIEGALYWSEQALDIVPGRSDHQLNAALFRSMVGPKEPIQIPDGFVTDYPTYVVIPVRDRHEMTRTLLDQLDAPPESIVILDNNSQIPAREALAGRARIVEHELRNLSKIWNIGIDLVSADQTGPFNVAVLNNDLEVPPGFLQGLATGLRIRDDHLIAYPDEHSSLAPGICSATGRMAGFAFMLRGEAQLRADTQFVWWYGDDDLAQQARSRGKVVRVGGVGVRHLAPNVATVSDPELAKITAEDSVRFAAKWGR
jgi:tetratricopeptide (TPR) repeat protein